MTALEDVPRQLAEPEEPIAAVLMHMLGDLTGRTLLIFPKQTAKRLAELARVLAAERTLVGVHEPGPLIEDRREARKRSPRHEIAEAPRAVPSADGDVADPLG